MDGMDTLEASTEKTDMEDLVIEDHSNPEDLLVDLTKALISNIPVSGRPVNKDKSRCFKCKEFGHFQDECPTNKSSQEEGSGPNKFEDYTYTVLRPRHPTPNAD